MKYKIDNVYVADCKEVAQSLSGQADLIYADIIYGDFESVPLRYLARSLRLGGAFWLQTDYRSVAQAKLAMDEILDFVNWVVWPYDWGGRPKDAFGRKHDDLLFYVRKGGKRTFNAKAVAIKKVALINSTKDWKIPTDVWSDIGNFYTTSRERIKGKDGRGIIWQKPEKLLERIILACTNRGDLVFEPYLGTGTACAVAKRLGRRYIGCDLKSEMVRVTKKRLSKIGE